MNCPHCSQALADVIPKHRFDEVNTELKGAKSRLDELGRTAGVSEKLASEVQTLRDQLASRDAMHAREVAFLGAGLNDPSVREVFGLHFDRQAAQEGGKKDAAEWLAHIQSAPENMPSVLSALLPGGRGKPAQAPASAPTGTPNGAWLPTPTQSNVKSPPTAAPAYTADAINRMSLDEFSRSYEAIIASNPALQTQFSPRLPWAKPAAANGKP